MKPYILLFFLAVFVLGETRAQNEFDLNPSQSMLMTGKGQGQDGAVNPYYGQTCYAIVENRGKGDFSVRIQQDGEIIETITVAGMEVKRIKLLKDHELYIDSGAEDRAKLKLEFEKIEN